MLTVFSRSALPRRAPGVVGLLYREIVAEYGKGGNLDLTQSKSFDNDYCAINELPGLRFEGENAGVEFVRKVSGGQAISTVKLCSRYEAPDRLFGDLRLIEGRADLELQGSHTMLHQSVRIDPNRPGLDILGYPKKLVDIAMWMEMRTLELAEGLPDCFLPLPKPIPA